MIPDEPSSPLARALTLLQRAEDALLASLLGGMIVLASAQIVLRNFFDAGISWADPLLRAAVLWLGLLGALAASRGDRQINVDVLSRPLPPRAHQAVRVLTSLFTAAVSGLVAWHAITIVRLDLEAGVVAFGAVPAWVVEAVIPLAFGLIAVRYVLLGAAHARAFVTGASP